ICEVLGVPRSSYYHAATPTPSELSDRDIGEQIEAVFNRHRRRYGYRRIWSELADQGITCAPARVRRIMMERGLKALQPKTYVPRTSDGRADKPAPNLLVEKDLPDRPDRVWAGDITHVPTAAGWLYLAVVIDLCTRRIVGWSLARHMRAGLVADAFKQALQTRRPETGLIFHSDRGSQYGSGEYRSLL
uniref:IS3 family transposase n=1 Tax=Luteolibacter marinus TaxID=2776705 RepID=UPI001866CA57